MTDMMTLQDATRRVRRAKVCLDAAVTCLELCEGLDPEVIACLHANCVIAEAIQDAIGLLSAVYGAPIIEWIGSATFEDKGFNPSITYHHERECLPGGEE